ncbi:hypothetical protein SAMD00019534_110940 [Acytostelium subglobosum LB1]|uniref:hypothetical protein n=1 Tax=Acytostelium subglobosum LB1 TaxID=1410327 RepID=UPI000644AB7A|nr:hypothetical protein SAMD00019534_110940 [Acytostelium subglobosum LB1]GAM27918.1 hypothetical protein SAMD00019534_110940 [Acytostelium subglobosum LB1]|eukprot:XP_012749201.1 hypothetical protein SAMD00019534_110940 [Acytostelium subglobosum LB1]
MDKSNNKSGCFFKEIEALKYQHHSGGHGDVSTTVTTLLSTPRGGSSNVTVHPQTQTQSTDPEQHDDVQLLKNRIEQLEKMIGVQVEESQALRRDKVEAKNDNDKMIKVLENSLASKEDELQGLRTLAQQLSASESSTIELKQQLQVKSDRITLLQEQLDELGQERNSLEDDANITQQQLDKFRADISTCKTLATEMINQLNRLTIENEELQQQCSLDERNVQAYRAKIDNFMELWSQQDQLWRQLLGSPGGLPRQYASTSAPVSPNPSNTSFSKSRTPVKIVNSPLSIKEYL